MWLLVVLGIAVQAGSLRELERDMVELINVEREARGLKPLALFTELAEVAREHSRVMMTSKKVTHEADGSLMEERIQKKVSNACLFGENITRHYNIEYALSDLMSSPGHRGNLLDPRYDAVGIGIEKDDKGLLYITQDFVSWCKQDSSKKKPSRD
jgi:uncharacterized protein YkwD